MKSLITHDAFLGFGDDYRLIDSSGCTWEDAESFFIHCCADTHPDDIETELPLGKRYALPSSDKFFKILVNHLFDDYELADSLDRAGFVQAVNPWRNAQRLFYFVDTGIKVDITKEKEAWLAQSNNV